MNKAVAAGLIALAAVAAVAIVGPRWADGPRVDTFLAIERPIRQTLLLTGRVVSPGRVDLGFQAQGTVVEVAVEEGDTVEAGALLVRIADDEATARLHEAEAQVAQAQAKLRRVQGVGRRVASERVTQAEVALADAERRLARADELGRTGGLNEQAWDAARRDRDTLRSQLVAAELEAAATGATGADTATAAAELARALAALEIARAGLDRTRLRAPASATVLQRRVELGQVVGPADVLVQLAGSGPLEVQITPDEVHLGALTVGLPARIVVEAFADQPLDARVSAIAPQIDPARGTVEVRLGFEGDLPGITLRPDMSATVEVLLGSSDRARVLPTWLVRDLGGSAPWVLLVVDGVATARPITVGLLGDELVEIAAGLGPDDAVIPPEAKVEPGDPVRPRSPVPAPAGG